MKGAKEFSCNILTSSKWFSIAVLIKIMQLPSAVCNDRNENFGSLICKSIFLSFSRYILLSSYYSFHTITLLQTYNIFCCFWLFLQLSIILNFFLQPLTIILQIKTQLYRSCIHQLILLTIVYFGFLADTFFPGTWILPYSLLRPIEFF